MGTDIWTSYGVKKGYMKRTSEQSPLTSSVGGFIHSERQIIEGCLSFSRRAACLPCVWRIRASNTSNYRWCIESSPSNTPCNDSVMCLHLMFLPKALQLALTHLLQLVLVLRALSHIKGSAVEFHCCSPQWCQWRQLQWCCSETLGGMACKHT